MDQLIPCKANKCILYPVCISKETIHCDHLSEYYKNLSHLIDKDNRTINGEQTYGSYREAAISAWQVLNKSFPNATRILSGYQWK